MKKYWFLFVLLLTFSVPGCYYDKYDELYPASSYNNNCDTSGKYSTVSKIFLDYCVACHNASQNSGGHRLDTYAEAYNTAKSGRLVGAVKQQSGYTPMPQGGKLDSCRIKAIENWVKNGSPNN